MSEDPWNPTAGDKEQAVLQLKACVERCFRVRFGMADDNLKDPLFLVKKHIPAVFHELNQGGEGCRGCTQLELSIQAECMQGEMEN